MTAGEGFGEFFRTATGQEPYDHQRRLAGDPTVAHAIVDGPKSLAIGQGRKEMADQILGIGALCRPPRGRNYDRN
jgi:hypothetical protein